MNSQSSTNAVSINSKNNNNNNNNDKNNNPYVLYTPLSVPSSHGNNQSGIVLGTFNLCGKKLEEATRKAEIMVDNLWNHLRVSPRLSEAALARLAQGKKVVVEGGYSKVFQDTFQCLVGEKLLKSYACYLSTASSPIIGTLFISNLRIAFCSDFPLTHYSSLSTNHQCFYYKVEVQNEQLRAVSPMVNKWNSEKYIRIVTKDGFDFWFMGFISYDKALKNLLEALKC